MGRGWLWVVVPTMVVAVLVGFATGRILLWFLLGVGGSVVLVAAIYALTATRRARSAQEPGGSPR